VAQQHTAAAHQKPGYDFASFSCVRSRCVHLKTLSDRARHAWNACGNEILGDIPEQWRTLR
jgi:hypothetical protein